MDIDSIFQGVSSEEIKSVLVGASVDFNKVKDMTKFRTAALHCCLNGPVGVGKITSFPGIGEEIKLKDLYDGRFTNKMWRNFCRVVGEYLLRNHADIVEESQQRKLEGTVWPQNEEP